MANLELPIAQRSHLLAMKILSAHPQRRPQDLTDIRALLLEASPREIGEVGKLSAKWKRAIARFAPRPVSPRRRSPGAGRG
jgi:hypothetical protein